MESPYSIEHSKLGGLTKNQSLKEHIDSSVFVTGLQLVEKWKGKEFTHAAVQNTLRKDKAEISVKPVLGQMDKNEVIAMAMWIILGELSWERAGFSPAVVSRKLIHEIMPQLTALVIPDFPNWEEKLETHEVISCLSSLIVKMSVDSLSKEQKMALITELGKEYQAGHPKNRRGRGGHGGGGQRLGIRRLYARPE